MHCKIGKLVGLVFALLITSALSTFAQGVQVRPAFIEAEVPAGRDVLIPIDILNAAGFDDRSLEVSLVPLGQNPDGQLVPIETADAAVSERTMIDWAEVPEAITVPATGAVRLDLLMRVPRAARGFYTGALLISAPPPENPQGISLQVRLMIPIIISIESRPVRQEVSLADAEIVLFVEPDPAPNIQLSESERYRSTFVNTVIANTGDTYATVRGQLYVDHGTDSGAWRQVRQVPIPQLRILPQTTLNVPIDLERRLPEGTYRVRGELFVNGRRAIPLRQEQLFEGDPDVESLQYDLALEMAPDVFEFVYRDSATRSGIISLENPGLDPITVTIDVAHPRAMIGQASATTRGIDLSAADWVEIQPRSFRLQPAQQRNIRVLARFPGDPADYENYYAEIDLTAEYPDGQLAGTASGFIEVTRPGNEDLQRALLEGLRLSETEDPEEFAISFRLVNLGNVLLRPDVSFALIDQTNTNLINSAMTSDVDAPLLPLESRVFGGLLDLEGLQDGEYGLRTLVRSERSDVLVFLHRVTLDDGELSFDSIGAQPLE